MCPSLVDLGQSTLVLALMIHVPGYGKTAERDFQILLLLVAVLYESIRTSTVLVKSRLYLL